MYLHVCTIRVKAWIGLRLTCSLCSVWKKFLRLRNRVWPSLNMQHRVRFCLHLNLKLPSKEVRTCKRYRLQAFVGPIRWEEEGVLDCSTRSSNGELAYACKLSEDDSKAVIHAVECRAKHMGMGCVTRLWSLKASIAIFKPNKCTFSLFLNFET